MKGAEAVCFTSMLESHRLFRVWCCDWLVLVTALCTLAPVLGAQRVDALHQQAWSTEQGLPQDSVHAIYQDHTGYIWLATEGGIARFDGINFKTFNHGNEAAFISDDACCLAEDGNQDLWIGTADGLIRVHNGSFIRMSERDGLPSPAIRGLLTDSGGSLLVLTAAGLARWKGDRFEAVPHAPPDVQSMERGPSGGVLVLASGRIFLLKDGAVSPQLIDTSRTVSPKGVRVAAGGEIWTFSNTEVARVGSGPSRHWQAGKQLPGNRVQSFFVDRAGAAWVGTNEGLAVIGKDAANAVRVPSLSEDSVLQTFEDREGNYWVGTESSGVHLLRSLAFRTEPGTANKPVSAVVQGPPGTVWLGTRRDGLLRVKNGEIDEPVRTGSLTSPLILSLASETDGGVWAGTPDGLNHVDARGTVQRWTSADGLPDDYIQALASDKHGCIWIGTRRGLAHLCGRHMDVQTKANGLAGDLIGTLLLARTGDLWVGTSGGLSRRSRDGQLTTYGTSRSRLQGIVSAMAEDPRGRIWVATGTSGLSRITPESVRHVDSALFDAGILGMAADNEGYLWLRKERGVDRVALRDLDRCVEAGITCSPPMNHYGVADGLPSEEPTPAGSPALCMMEEGELWIGTRRGVGIADTGRMPLNHVPPGVAIESFLVDGVPRQIDSGSLSVPYGGQRFTVEYAGLSFVVPTEVRYRFKLEGYDSGWTEAGTRRSATYTNLPPRTFTFRVQAMNNAGIWNETGAALSFRIVPPFYRRWWFFVLVTLFAAAVASGLYQLRLRGLRTQFAAVLQERNRMAREIHDTLAQDFVGVTLQLDIIAQMLGMKKIEAAVQQVAQARKLVTEGLAEARQSIWELRANAATDSLPTRLGKVVERYTSDKPAIRTKIGGAFRQLDRRIEAEFLRVAQEALSNVQRHSQASNASVELHYGGDALVLTVEDDGRGFVVDDALRSHERYGLSGLRERANLLGGTLEIASAPGKGTKITLTTEITPTKDNAREREDQGDGR